MIRKLLLPVCFISTGLLHAQSGFSFDFVGTSGFSGVSGTWYNQDMQYDGPNADLVVAYTKLTRHATFSYNTGFNIGYHLSEKWSFHAGIRYEKMGQHFAPGTSRDDGINYHPTDTVRYSDVSTITASLDLTYLKMPVFAEYHFNPQNRISFTVSGGFYIAYLLGYTDAHTSDREMTTTYSPQYYTPYNFYGGYNYSNTSSSTDKFYSVGAFRASFPLNSRPYNAIDPGVTLGIGMQIRLSDKVFLPIMLNGQLGLRDIKNTDSQVSGNPPGSNPGSSFYFNTYNPIRQSFNLNEVIGLTIGFRFFPI
jgi:hypothetical protein